jgi:Glycosyl hydrolase family 99
MALAAAAGRATVCLMRSRTTGQRGALWLSALAAVAIAIAAPAPARAGSTPAASPIPVLAYYYIWYTPTSWQRAKRDLPLLGPYSSDQASIMRQHVIWAKGAGINGFVVSWKSTQSLDLRLSRLVSIADAEHFKLALIYEGLDFERKALPAGRIATDLKRFTELYGHHPAFRLFGRRPVVIWSGTWKFPARAIAAVKRQIGSRLQLLASEKNVAGYLRVAPYVDGDAYYWSSADLTTPGYPTKLVAMGRAVHAHGGLWIAPAASGFDGRLLGGSRVVPRRNGATLRREFAGALSSSPDAVGLISWNEFSENSQIEPSRNFGFRYLRVVANITGTRAAAIPDFNSDEQPARGTSYGLTLLVGAGVVCVAGGVALFYRRRRRPPVDPGAAPRGSGGA